MPSQDPSDAVEYIALARDLPMGVARAEVTKAIRAACSRGASGLLVDLHNWDGGPSPSIGLRIDVTLEWAEAATVPGFAMAVVLPPDKMDPGRIGPILARGRGFNFHVCDSLDEARAWLEGGRRGRTPGGTRGRGPAGEREQRSQRSVAASSWRAVCAG